MRKYIIGLIWCMAAGAGLAVYELFSEIKPQPVVDPWYQWTLTAFNQHDVEHINESYRAKMIDCSDESRSFGSEPIQSYPFLGFYAGKFDPFNGLYFRNSFPLFVHSTGHTKLTEDSSIFIGFRGDTAGVHRSLLTPQVHKIATAQPNGVFFMAGSYVRYASGIFQSVCHRRHYPEIGYVGSDWPALRSDPWHPIRKFFGNHKNLYLFSYSNGGVVRDQMIRATSDLAAGAVLDRARDYSDEYQVSSLFIYPDEVNQIRGMIDIETNYSRADIWNVLKVIREKIYHDQRATYYAATTVEGVMALNHVYMVKALGLEGAEMENGVVRYQNALGNVTIDFITAVGYRYLNVSLVDQIPFKRNPKIRYRLNTGHYKIVAYATNSFYDLAKKRGVLF